MIIENEYEVLGFRQIEFHFNEKRAIVIFPSEANDNGKVVLKTEYFEAFPDLQMQFVKRGYTLIYLENTNRWGTDCDINDQYKFINYIAKEFGKENSAITIGMSCGGLIAVNLCAKYPESVNALYLDAPVLNFLSFPAKMGIGYDISEEAWKEFEGIYHITKSELLTYRNHPMDKLPILLNNNKKIYLVYGDSDHIVPFSENGLYLENYYKENGGKIIVEKKEGVGHHPHGPLNCDVVIDFLEKE